MRALLSNHDVKIALEIDESEWFDVEKKKIMREAYNLLVLGMFDNILKKVCTCNTTPKLRNKLEEPYLNQVTSNLAYLKAAYLAFKMDPNKALDDILTTS